eukprot:604177_1
MWKLDCGYVLCLRRCPMIVQWTVHCHEANLQQTWTNHFDEQSRSHGWSKNTVSFAEFSLYNTWTVSLNINVLTEFDVNGEEIAASAWNEHKEPTIHSESKSQSPPSLPNQVSAFLSDLGLEQYIEAFMENGFEAMEELKDLTNDEFKEMGVVKIAHRKKIQKGITAHLTTNSNHKKKEESKQNEKQIAIERENITRKKALVICVGIAKYIYLKNLNTAKDLTMYRSLFEDKYNYTVIANDPSQPMNKDDVEGFLRKARNIDLYDFADGRLNYDALIVTFGGHGTLDSVICSDGSKYKHKAMRKIFFID